MDLDILRQVLMRAGWEDIHPMPYRGIPFDLVGSRGKIVGWKIIIKKIHTLTQEVAATWQQNFQKLNDEARGYWVGECFIMCLIAQEVSPDLLPALLKNKLDWEFKKGWKGGGGHTLVVDMKNKQVYGTTPSIPLDLRKHSRLLKEILIKMMIDGYTS